MRLSPRRRILPPPVPAALAAALVLATSLLACRAKGQEQEQNESPTAPPSVLDELIARARTEGSVRVVVEFLLETAPEADLHADAVKEQRLRIDSAQDYLRQGLQGSFEEERLVLFGRLPFLSLRLEENGLRRLEALAQELEKIAAEAPGDPRAGYRFRYSADVELKAHTLRGARAASAGLAGGPAWLADTRDLIGVSALPTTIQGQGISIAVIDDGVDVTLPILGGSAPAGAFFTSEEALDCAGVTGTSCRGAAALGLPFWSPPPPAWGCPELSHGTAVAIAACSDQGIAPAAQVIPIRVEDSSGTILLSDVARALADLLESWWQPHAIGVVCISVGSSETFRTLRECSGGSRVTGDAAFSAMALACASARAANLPVVVSAGNDGARGLLPSPACLDTTIAVASTMSWVDLPAGLVELHIPSNWAEGVELGAPGVQMSVGIGGVLCGLESGTSIAAPLVAGALALLRQGAPGADVDSLLVALQASSYRVESPSEELVGGALTTVVLQRPFLRVDAALELLGWRPVPTPSPPPDDAE